MQVALGPPYLEFESGRRHPKIGEDVIRVAAACIEAH